MMKINKLWLVAMCMAIPPWALVIDLFTHAADRAVITAKIVGITIQLLGIALMFWLSRRKIMML